jgi:hypothetical protein
VADAFAGTLGDVGEYGERFLQDCQVLRRCIPNRR